MRAVELYFSPQQLSVMLSLHPKTVLERIRDGAFGHGVVNLGGERRPDYRVPASAVNEFLDARRVFHEQVRD